MNYATGRYDSSLVNGATIASTTNTYKVGSSALSLVSTGVYGTSPYVKINNGIIVGNSGLTFAVWYVIIHDTIYLFQAFITHHKNQ